MFTGFTGRKSVASVLSVFNKTIEDLRQVEVEQESEAVRNAQLISEAQAEYDAAIQEAAMARDVQSKLLNIITPMVPMLGSAALIASEAL